MTSGAPIACSLDAGDYRERVELIAALAARWGRGRVRRGSLLVMTYDRAAAESLRELVRLEAACCAFLRFELREHGEVVRLRVAAPEGVDHEAVFAPFLG